MPTINLSTGTVRYLEQGEGKPLVLLHANPGDARDYEAVIPELAKNHRVIAIDWPGYGLSDMPAQPEVATVLLYYQVLREFLSALELPPSIFIGNSIGGNVAARLASEAPELVRGLVLVAPAGFTPHNLISRAFCNFQGSRFSFSPFIFASFYLKVRTPTAMAMLERASGPQSTQNSRTLNRAMWRSFAKPESDLREKAKAIKVPTLLLFGKSDLTIPANKDGKVAKQVINSATLVTLPCGHTSFAEVPELFLAEVQAYLKSL